MSFDLTVLGGSAAWPNPGQGCSSYLLRAGAESLVLDCGADTLLELRKHVNYAAVDAVILSHLHADHMLDLVPYRYGLVYGPARPQRPIPLWIPAGARATLDALGHAVGGYSEPGMSFWDGAFDLREYEPSKHLDIGTFHIEFAETQHFAACYAMRVTVGERAFVYSADTGTVEPLVDFTRGAHMLLAEATEDAPPVEANPVRGHVSPQEAGLLAQLAGVEQLVLTHLWSERPDEDALNAARRAFSGPIAVAKPGLRLDI
jgi:ribonuclease BN (tRNA processing enzyme)